MTQLRTPTPVRRRVLAALNALGRRATIADVAAETGLGLDQISTTLNELAGETQAHLEVGSSGTIYYTFPDHLNYLYFSNALARCFSIGWARVRPALDFLFKISFGLALLFSIALVFLIVLMMQICSSVVGGNTRVINETIRDFYFLLRKLGVYRLLNSSSLKSSAADGGDDGEEPTDRGFLLNCHSFLFGPGDPNADFDEARSQAIAQLIASKGGVVVPEELSPYTGRSPKETEQVFPILGMFHGIPATTASGHLIYLFPSMRSSSRCGPAELDGLGETADPGKCDAAVSAVRISTGCGFRKEYWSFSGLNKEALMPVLYMGLFNFSGTLFFWWLLYVGQKTGPTAISLWVLAAYGTFFLLFPMMRWCTVALRNRSIASYNELVDYYAAILVEPDEELTSVLAEAEDVRRHESEKGGESLVYTTTSDYVEQEALKLERSFDRALSAGNGTAPVSGDATAGGFHPQAPPEPDEF